MKISDNDLKRLISSPSEYGFTLMVKNASCDIENDAFLSSFNLCKRHARVAGDLYISEHQDLITVITDKQEYYIVDLKRKIIGKYLFQTFDHSTPS